MTIIAEIGTAHTGSISKAKELINAAKEAGADCIKFQWVYADEILHPKTGFVNLPGGKIPLFDRFRELEVNKDFFVECLEYTHGKGLLFACSPFGIKSLHELAEINPDAIKIASPEVNHIPLLKECAQYYGRIPIILSSGVSSLGDIERAVSILKSNSSDSDGDSFKKNKNGLAPLTLLHCETCYPAPESEYNVKCVKTLAEIFGLPTGISDHSMDPVLVPSLAAVFGATVIEKHITLSRNTSGLDDPVALEAEQFALMAHCARQAEAVLERFRKERSAQLNCIYRGIPEEAVMQAVSQLSQQFDKDLVIKCIGSGIKKLALSEKQNYGRTNRSLHYMHSMKKGQKILEGDIAVLRTEKILSPGIPPEFLSVLEGAVLSKDTEGGAGVQFEDFLLK